MKSDFRALVVEKLAGDDIKTSIKKLECSNLSQGDLTLKVLWSSLNYKDALAIQRNGKVVSSYPIVPGIDLCGIVEGTTGSKFVEGDRVIVSGYGLGVSSFGGFSEYARVPEAWAMHLPESLTPKEAMTLGTAGFTAALCLYALEKNDLEPARGPVIVTGASGGVGSIAVALLSHRGYHVVASTGKETAHQFLRELGANEILRREEISRDSNKALEKERWAGAIDPVGGISLASLLRSTKYGGSVAVCGLTGGTDFRSTVFPFIIRGVNLLGIDSVNCPMELRQEIWERLATNWRVSSGLLEKIGTIVKLDDVQEWLGRILSGQVTGRCVLEL
jgi:acrylyl-CoA reductase (NADPH)